MCDTRPTSADVNKRSKAPRGRKPTSQREALQKRLDTNMHKWILEARTSLVSLIADSNKDSWLRALRVGTRKQQPSRKRIFSSGTRVREAEAVSCFCLSICAVSEL